MMQSSNSVLSAEAKKALARLEEGNRRFVSDLRSVESMISRAKMAELAEKGQFPFAIVLTCSDSRSPVELIFDQGVGELFVVRVAGNVVAPSLIASIEFAATQFGSCLVLVLGHTKCGAIGAAIQNVKNPGVPLPSVNLEDLLQRIRPSVRDSNGNVIADMGIAIANNVRNSIATLRSQSQILTKLESEGKIGFVGGVLDISNGKVDFI
ncbi:MAG: carbonic anhydrase [Bdellovibrionales bacterium]|nr:carbonic anhydrase [Bdellovibrionales bacterium]